MDTRIRCARPGCGAASAALLRYDYAGATVWIDDPDDDRRSHAFGLCAPHADTLTVPVGWTCEDRRLPIGMQSTLGFRPPVAV